MTAGAVTGSSRSGKPGQAADGAAAAVTRSRWEEAGGRPGGRLRRRGRRAGAARPRRAGRRWSRRRVRGAAGASGRARACRRPRR